MNTFIDIESLGNHNKNEFINKRRLLICGSCYWCSSYLLDLENDILEYFDSCPMCNEKIMSMLISRKSMASHVQNSMIESEDWVTS
jgi:hypothetical protein